mmetsp:Transcript_22706/g.31625  ORF Transcript_22706/g.31625 Transcript_22706/m.31625 type:complete len:397 (-) Transcript_22706:15-1205(-)
MGRKNKKQENDEDAANNSNNNQKQKKELEGFVPSVAPDGVDLWKTDEFKPGDMRYSLVEESSFATLFPKYREQYLKEVWPVVTKHMNQLGIEAELDLVQGSMKVKTTKKTWDPYAIIKARDMIRLLSRSVPVSQALKIMDDDVSCAIINIGGFSKSKDKFLKRRQRLIGPEGATLKALQLVTECFVQVQGKTVVAMGSYKGIEHVKEIVEDCMKNIHPIYGIKKLMIMKELEKDSTLSKEDWSRFLPAYKKKNIKRKVQPIQRKEYTPFPPAPTMRKEDMQLETGEYFLTEEQRAAKERKQKKKQQEEKEQEKQKEKEKVFRPPKEKVKPNPEQAKPNTVVSESAEAIKERLLKNMKKRKAGPSFSAVESTKQNKPAASDFLLQPAKKQKSKVTDE